MKDVVIFYTEIKLLHSNPLKVREENHNNGEINHIPIGKLNIKKTLVPPIWIYRLNAIPGLFTYLFINHVSLLSIMENGILILKCL